MTKRIVFTMLMITFFVFAAVSPVHAQDTGPLTPETPVESIESTGELVNETPHLWFVELSSEPTISGTALSAVNAEHAAFKANAESAGIVYTERYSYSSLFNGFSISINPSDLAKLSRLPGVKNVYPVQEIKMPQTTVSAYDPELYTSLNMIGAATVHSELGYTGAGIKVAVMDTGIDVNNPALGGNGIAERNSPFFYENPRIKFGYDFVGDYYNADYTATDPGLEYPYNLTTTPDTIPDDCAGHGTHVAGIIGANDADSGLMGVAPDVTFGAYRVFGCDGSTSDDIMLAAMELAEADGMQVLNMSIGSAFDWPQAPTAKAASLLVKNGMVVVASIGNSGSYGLYATGAPGLGEDVIGVASYDNTNVFLPYFTVDSNNVGYITMAYSPEPPTSGSGEIVDIGLACSTVTTDLTGKVALASRGTCAFAVKAENAIAAGADAVLISNNSAGIFEGTLGAPLSDPTIPVVGISQADGVAIRALTAPITMTWTDQMESFPSPTGGLISSFSSYGLSPDLALKPDIGAPGGNIYSTYPLELCGEDATTCFTTMSGTSMASPHVAGSAALLLEAKPNTKATAVRGILQNSAEPKLWSLAPGLGLLDLVHRQGAGMVQIDKAITSAVKVTPSKIATGESQAGSFTQTLTLKNTSSTKVKYNLSYENAISSEGVVTPGFWDSDAKVKFSAASVTVPAKGKATVTVTIKPATYPENGQYGGYIIFTPTDPGTILRVPFAGYVGDYQEIEVLGNEYGLPWLVSYYSAAFPLTDPSEWTFSMQGDDIPFIWVHLDHQALKMKIKVYDAATDQGWGTVLKESYLTRNSTADSFFEIGFDGYTTKSGKLTRVPDGTYYMVLSVLKANGNSANPADWETWTSPDFVIERP